MYIVNLTYTTDKLNTFVAKPEIESKSFRKFKTFRLKFPLENVYLTFRSVTVARNLRN